jgi:hypothetical protein
MAALGSLRILRKHWKLTVVAVVSLTVAMAMGVLCLSLSNTFLLQAPAAPQPDRLVMIHGRSAATAVDQISYPDYQYLRDHNHVFTDIAADPNSISLTAIRTSGGTKLRYSHGRRMARILSRKPDSAKHRARMVKILDLSEHMGLRIAGRPGGHFSDTSRIHRPEGPLLRCYIRSWKSLISGDDDERMIASHFLAMRPSIGLVVAGDVAYNDVHIHLGESNADSRQEWIAALDMIESLKPRAVIAGHKRPGRSDAPGIVEETRQYIRDFDRIEARTQTAKELYDQMLAIYPDRVNSPMLWNSARAVKG